MMRYASTATYRTWPLLLAVSAIPAIAQMAGGSLSAYGYFIGVL
jgi:hypothetical protein